MDMKNRSTSHISREPQSLRSGPRWGEILLLYIPIIRNTILIRQRNNYTTIDFWAIIDIIAFLCIVCIMGANWAKIPWKKINQSPLKWWMTYYVFCIFSIFWRVQGSSVAYICYRSLAMLSMTIYSLWIMAKFSNKNIAFQHVIIYIWWIAILGLLHPLMKGQGLHTNSYSISAAIVAIILLALHAKIYNQKYRIILITSIVLLILGTSAGTNAAFAAAVMLWAISLRQRINMLSIICCVILAYLIFSYGFSLIVQYIFPNKTMESISNMTGRTFIWENYINAWQSSPWLGYGFSVGERSGESFGCGYYLSAHNGFISVLINTGIVGILIFGSFIFGFMIDLYRHIQHMTPYALPIFLAMVVIMVNNFTFPLIGSIWTADTQSCIFLFSYCAIFINNN